MSVETVDVLVCNTSMLTATDVDRLLHLLSADERDRQGRFGFERDRRDYIAAHALLRITLGSMMNIAPERLRFEATARGKPFLLSVAPAAASPCFSITHSRGFVACAIGAHDSVGVDIEVVDRSVRANEVAEQCFSNAEAEAVRLCSEDERVARFCELWTLKESLAKALGVGIARTLRAPSFCVLGDRLRVNGARKWAFILADIAGTHKLAVATRPHQHVRLSIADPHALGRIEPNAVRVSLRAKAMSHMVTSAAPLRQLAMRETDIRCKR